MSFLSELAKAQPDPGGGAAAAYGAALSLALVEKVVQLERHRARNKSQQTDMWEVTLEQTRQFNATLARLQDEDVQAYANLARARASTARGQELLAAIHGALLIPRQIMDQAHEALNLVARVGKRCQKHLLSDLLVAVEFLGAALQGAYHIARANLPLMEMAAGREALRAELNKAAHLGRKTWRRVKEELAAREHRG